MRQATGKNNQQVFGGRCLDGNGRPIGTPQLNSYLYNVEFKDCITDVISANTIANEIWYHVVESGNSDTLLNSILDYKFVCKTVKGDGYVIDCDGKSHISKTTAGDNL